MAARSAEDERGSCLLQVDGGGDDVVDWDDPLSDQLDGLIDVVGNVGGAALYFQLLILDGWELDVHKTKAGVMNGIESTKKNAPIASIDDTTT